MNIENEEWYWIEPAENKYISNFYIQNIFLVYKIDMTKIFIKYTKIMFH